MQVGEEELVPSPSRLGKGGVSSKLTVGEGGVSSKLTVGEGGDSVSLATSTAYQVVH